MTIRNTTKSLCFILKLLSCKLGLRLEKHKKSKCCRCWFSESTRKKNCCNKAPTWPSCTWVQSKQRWNCHYLPVGGGQLPLLYKFCWYWAFSQILKTDTSSNCACRSLCDLQASYPASHTSTSRRHPDIHKHHRGKTRLLTATAVHRNDDNEKKQQLWKNINLENA